MCITSYCGLNLQSFVQLNRSVIDDHVNEPQENGDLLFATIVFDSLCNEDVDAGLVGGELPDKLENVVHWDTVF